MRKNKQLIWAPLGMKKDGIMLIQSTLTKSTKLSKYIESPWWTTQFWWRTTCMSLMAHMDRTQCEEVNLLYMERMGAFFLHDFDYHLILVYLDLASSCCLARLQCCLELGVPEQESHLLPWVASWESFVMYWYKSRLEAKHQYLVTTLFLLSIVLCCRVLQWRFDNTTSKFASQ